MPAHLVDLASVKDGVDSEAHVAVLSFPSGWVSQRLGKTPESGQQGPPKNPPVPRMLSVLLPPHVSGAQVTS